MKKLKKTFVIFSQSYYADSIRDSSKNSLVDDISIQINDDYEIVLEWIGLENNKPSSLKVGIFDDAFKIFTDCPELFIELSKLHGQKSPTVEEIASMLKKLGFKDKTLRKRPK